MKLSESKSKSLLLCAMAFFWSLSAFSLKAQERGLLAEVEINTDFNLIFMPISVNNHTSWFILDTGAPGSAVDEDLASEWGLSADEKKPSKQLNGVVMEADVDVFQFDINDLKVTLQGRARTAPIKRSGFSGFLGKDFGGILGYDFINQYTIEVDYYNNRLRVYDKDQYEYDGDGIVLNARVTRTRPLIDGVISESGKKAPATWLMDTGSLMFMSLNTAYVENNNLHKTINTIPSMTVGAGGTGDGVIYKFDAVELAGHTFKSPISSHSSELINDFVEGVIGGEFFHRYKVILDYERDRAILEPNDKLEKPIRYDLSGMQFKAEGEFYDVMRVSFVYEGSPAAKLGIQEGDVLESIDGREAAKITFPKIWRMFRENEGDAFDLVINRNGKKLNKRLVLKDYFK